MLSIDPDDDEEDDAPNKTASVTPVPGMTPTGHKEGVEGEEIGGAPTEGDAGVPTGGQNPLSPQPQSVVPPIKISALVSVHSMTSFHLMQMYCLV